VIIGLLVILYTASGGTKAVSWTHVHQLLIALGGMAMALIIAVHTLPVGFLDAVRIAGRMGRLNAIDFSFDLTTPYNFWSGMIGGLLVALSYFGTDQSQVQRYLTGASVAESRLGLLINGMVKVPMQFFILFVGAMIFVFYQFVAPPLFFNSVERARVAGTPEYARLEQAHRTNFVARRAAVIGMVRDPSLTSRVRELQREEDSTRRAARDLIRRRNPGADISDANYVFLSLSFSIFRPALSAWFWRRFSARRCRRPPPD
jgi:hypothetical protein